jgi:hypothetical protein
VLDISPSRKDLYSMSIREIEIAIAQLAPRDLAELTAWLVEYHAKVWDRKIEADLGAGRLDAVLADVDREYDAGLARPL